MKDAHPEKTDHPRHLWEGLPKACPACLFRYAEHLCDTRFQRPPRGPSGFRRQVRRPHREPHRRHREGAGIDRPARISCPSLGDCFDDRRPTDPEWPRQGWRAIRETPCLQWLVASDRPEDFARLLPEDWGEGYPNVCLLVTAEDQQTARRRLPLLLSTPARWRALAVEPLLDRVDLSPWIDRLDWVIAGGESLAGARPMNPNWVREIRDLCASRAVPFYFRQWGAWTPEVLLGDHHRYVFPDDETLFLRHGAKRNGNTLDGRLHLDHPFPVVLSREEVFQALPFLWPALGSRAEPA